jgi:hypothetical protein
MFRAYDGGRRQKTHYWIYGARHNGFNRSWLANNDNEHSVAATSLDPETAMNQRGIVEREPDLIVARTHERLAKALITPFLIQTFDLPVSGGAAAYARYLNGAILPPSIRDVIVDTQYAGGTPENTAVVDNFGDADTLLGLVEESIHKEQNTMGLTASAEGPGLQSWEDVSHVSLRGGPGGVNTPHATISTRIMWADGATEYRTLLRPRSFGPENVLSVRVGQPYPSILNPPARGLDMFVTLRDATGIEAVVRLGAVGSVPFPARHICPMRTVRLPLDAFTAVEPVLDLNRLESITFRLTARATGDVFIDDIEFTA